MWNYFLYTPPVGYCVCVLVFLRKWLVLFIGRGLGCVVTCFKSLEKINILGKKTSTACSLRLSSIQRVSKFV